MGVLVGVVVHVHTCEKPPRGNVLLGWVGLVLRSGMKDLVENVAGKLP